MLVLSEKYVNPGSAICVILPDAQRTIAYIATHVQYCVPSHGLFPMIQCYKARVCICLVDCICSPESTPSRKHAMWSVTVHWNLFQCIWLNCSCLANKCVLRLYPRGIYIVVVVELNYLHPFHLHPDSRHPDPPALMQCLHLLHNNCRSCSVLFSYSHIYNLFLPITCIC